MIGDHHVELVAGRGRVEVYLSDDERRPLRPVAGSLSTLGGVEIPLKWRRQRLVAELPPGLRPSLVRLTTPKGSSIELPVPGQGL
jgi:hypothetical protein